jgi:flavin reductase (DIM6/NTAB) family NADH-FMN oxidoreductase RutF
MLYTGGVTMIKKSITPGFMWHHGAILHSLPVTIITTLDELGRINAAPFSLVIPYHVGEDHPQVMVVSCALWHTVRNIEATGEFVVNYPPARMIQDVMETARMHSEGINELTFTSFTTMPSEKVKPPRIIQCYQHIECKVRTLIKPSELQINIIADVLDISFDDKFAGLTREQIIQACDVPVHLGLDENGEYIFSSIHNISCFSLDFTVEKLTASR